MPKYRFSWDAIPETVREELALAAGCQGPSPSEDLRRQYGARPKEEFVRDLWPTLREKWLARDDLAMSRVVESLRLEQLGKTEELNPIEFLRSIRNSKTMRAIVLSEFLDLGDAQHQSDRPAPKTLAEMTSSSSPKIGRPGRKQVQFNSLQESPEGRQFIDILVSNTGGEPEIVPLGKVRDTHIFAAVGSRGRALIAEESAQQSEADRWRSMTAFRTDSADAIESSIEMVRWDAWLAFDANEVRKATRSQRKAWDDRRVELAINSDTLQTRRPTSAESEPLLDLSSAEVQACWALLRDLPVQKQPALESTPVANGNGAAQVGFRVLELLRNTTGNQELVPDKDGDIPLQFGSSMVFVRVFGDPPIVRGLLPRVGEGDINDDGHNRRKRPQPEQRIH